MIASRRDGPIRVETTKSFPRYRHAESTLINIERLTFDKSLTSIKALRALADAGAQAVVLLSEQLRTQDLALAALHDQAASYGGFIKSLFALDPNAVRPLPFRRVLADEETSTFWSMLHQSWGLRGKGYGWFPMSSDPRPLRGFAVHEELWNSRDGGSVFKHFLREHDITRCFILRELGPPDYELDIELAAPSYDGSESFLFTDNTWVLYASHESSLTLAGSLADFFREVWKDVDELDYVGPYHTIDLRGTWNWP